MWKALLAAVMMLLPGSPAFAADVLPPQLQELAHRVKLAEAKNAEVSRQLKDAQKRHAGADKKLRAATLALVRAQRFPPELMVASTVLGGQPDLANMAMMVTKQSLADVNDVGGKARQLAALYGESRSRIDELKELQSQLADAKGKMNAAEEQALRQADIKAGELEKQLAGVTAVVEEAPPPLEDGASAMPVPKPAAEVQQKEEAKQEKVPAKEKSQAAAKPEEPDKAAKKPAEDNTVSGGAGPAPEFPLQGKVVQRFHKGRGMTEEGVVMRGKPGANVVSIVEGEVIYSGPFRQYGGLVIVKSPRGEGVLYGGLGSLIVASGEKIPAGRVVGTVGDDGKLYWEVRRKGRTVDPLSLKVRG